MKGLRRVATTVAALIVVLGASLLLPDQGQAARKIRVVGSSTDLIEIAKEIARDRVEVYSPFPGYQEPELWVEEVFPSWAIRASRADMYIRIGLFADVWAETLILDSRNGKIFPGEAGYVDASMGIPVLEVPTEPVDRSRGEIHIQGNPHYLLDPLNAKIVADNILRALVRISPEDAGFFRGNAEDFKRRIDRAMVRWQEATKPLHGKKLAAYHKTWSYLARRFGFEVVGYCEPKPGIEPSPRDIRNLVDVMVREKARLIIHEPVYSPRIPNAVAREVERQTGHAVRVLRLPIHVGGVPEATDVFTMFDAICDRFDAAMKGS